MNDITFVTGNQKKVTEMERILGIELKSKKIDLPELQSLDIKEVVVEKARRAFSVLGTSVIVEDTALVFHALGKLPGTFVKWFAEELDYEGMCRLLDGKEDSSATVYACIAYFDGENMDTFMGECKGTISESPRGGEGFGFDCIFIPEGYEETWSELPNEVKDDMSHRARAAHKLKDFLTQQATSL